MGHPPHSLIYLEDIGLDSAAFHCYTDNTNCCRGSDNPNGGAQGSWISPIGIVESRSQASDSVFSRTRDARALILHHGPNATGPTGIYTCQLPDRSGNRLNLFFGIYSKMGCKYPVIQLQVKTSL